MAASAAAAPKPSGPQPPMRLPKGGNIPLSAQGSTTPFLSRTELIKRGLIELTDYDLAEFVVREDNEGMTNNQELQEIHNKMTVTQKVQVADLIQRYKAVRGRKNMSYLEQVGEVMCLIDPNNPDCDEEPSTEELQKMADEAGFDLSFGRKKCKKNQYMSPSGRCRLKKNRPCAHSGHSRSPKTLKCRPKKFSIDSVTGRRVYSGRTLLQLQLIAVANGVDFNKKRKDGKGYTQTPLKKAALKTRLSRAGIKY